MEGKKENTKTNFKERIISATKFLAIFLFVSSWFFSDWLPASDWLPKVSRVQAARLWSSGFELNSLTNGVEFSNVTGATPVIVTSPVRSGTYALKEIPVLSTSEYVRNNFFEVDSGSGTNIFSRGYLRIATLPDAEVGIMSLEGTGFAFITLNSDGTLKLKNESDQIIGTSSALSTNTWYRIEMEVEFVTGASNDTVRARIDGATPFAQTTTETLSGGVKTATWGTGLYILNATSGEIYWDDLAINDDTLSNQNNFPGEGKIVHFKPNANGDNAMGSGSGCTDDDCVDETTPDDATTYYILDATNDILDVNIEATNLSSKSIGTSDTIKVVHVGVRHRGADTTSRTHEARIKSQASGTVSTGTAITSISTTWSTHFDGDPISHTLTSYTDPQTGGSWSASLIDSAQIGVRCTGATPDCWISTLWALVDYQPVLASQSAYRLFTNANSTDVGTPLAAQDTSATLGAAGDAFRLRLLMHEEGATLLTSVETFKLQFASKSGTCDTSFVGENYADVTADTVIAYNNNSTPADSDNLTANDNDPTHSGHTIVSQDYEELNNFTNSVAAINVGQDGKWDFSLKDNGAPAGRTYCFRIVKSDGTVLSAYSKIPEIAAATFGTAHGTTENTGVISETLTVPFGESWSVTASNSITLSSPVATADRLFVGDDGGKFYAVNTATGSVAWTFNAGNPINVSPTVEGTTVYFGDTGNKFYGRNISDGTAVFTHTASAAISVSPAINGNNVLFGLTGVGASNVGQIVAINKSTGSAVWTRRASSSFGNYSLAASGSLGFAADTGGKVYKFNTASGSVNCSYTASSDSFSRSSPVVSDDTIFIGSDGGLVYAINAADCALYNTFDVGSDVIATPVYDATNNKLYVGTIGGAFYRLAFDHGGANTFSQDWKITVGAPIESSSILTTGGTARLFVGADTWYVYNPSNGSYIWSSPIGRIAGSSIGVTSNAIFTANAAGKIYFFKETQVQGAFTRAWNYNTSSQIVSATKRSGNNLYLGTADKKLHSVTTAGALNWSFTASASIVTVRPEVDSTNGVVYFGTEDGQFWAVNTSDGTKKWQKDIGGLVTSQPVVEPSTNTIYVPSTRGKFYSLNATTGVTNQIYDTGLTGYNVSSPIITATGSFFTYGNRALVSLNKTTFNKTWEFSMGGSNITDNPIYITSSTSATNPRFFVGGVDGVYAVNNSGVQVWKRAITSPITAVTYDTGVASRAYATTQDGRAIGIKVSDGTQLWSTSVASASVPVSRPEIYQDVLFVNADKETRALAGEDGKVRTKFNLNLPSLAPVEVSSTDGQLFAGQIGGNVENFDTASYSMDVTRALGGTLTTIFNDQLIIPSNSINANATVTLDIDVNDVTPPVGTSAMPRKYKFLPSTATFSPAATLKIAYKTSDLKGEPEADIRLYLFQSGTNTYEEKTGTLDTANKLFSVSLTVFSRFASFVGLPRELRGPILATDKGYSRGEFIVPNYGPRTPGVTNVRAYLNGRYVKSGQKVVLNKLGKNVFIIRGVESNGGMVSYRQEFNVRPKPAATSKANIGGF